MTKILQSWSATPGAWSGAQSCLQRLQASYQRSRMLQSLKYAADRIVRRNNSRIRGPGTDLKSRAARAELSR